MDEKAFESGSSGQKSLRVFLVNPPVSEPWRTREEYLSDRRSAEELERRQEEAHRAMMDQVRMMQQQTKAQIRQMWIAFLALVIASLTMFFQAMQFQRDVSERSASILRIPASPVQAK